MWLRFHAKRPSSYQGIKAAQFRALFGAYVGASETIQYAANPSIREELAPFLKLPGVSMWRSHVNLTNNREPDHQRQVSFGVKAPPISAPIKEAKEPLRRIPQWCRLYHSR